MALILANSKYTYLSDGVNACGGYADLFEGNRTKDSIQEEMLSYINEGKYGLKEQEGLIAVFCEYENNSEDYMFFRFFNYIDSYTEEDYRNSDRYRTDGFGFIELRVL